MDTLYLPQGPEELIDTCFQDLLTNKHLYQCSRIDAIRKDEIRKKFVVGAEGFHIAAKRGEQFDTELGGMWSLKADGQSPVQAGFGVSISCTVNAPRIETYCHQCGKRVAFVSLYVYSTAHWHNDQTFHMVYECQGRCKKTKVCFLVRRTGEKLQLVGRDTFEAVEVPPQINATKEVKKFYSDAIIAYQAGQILPAIFMLRTFIEQYWKSIPEVIDAVKGIEKPRGDELGVAYKETLPPQFKEIYPTLTIEYEKLSGAIHSAFADIGVFESVKVEIERHFTARSALPR